MPETHQRDRRRPAELARLEERHGPLMLFQSGGCCEGSSPQCLHQGELLLGPNDLSLGEIDGTPFYIDAEQYRRWHEPALLLDLATAPPTHLARRARRRPLPPRPALLSRGKSGSRRY